MKKPKIYFVCPNNKHITGGVKQIYRQVEILNQNGFEAYVLHKKIGKRDKWFASDVPIKYSPFIFKHLFFLFQDKKIELKDKIILFFLKQISEKIDKDSILVFPEIYGSRIHEIEPKVKKVIFNQGCYLTFNGYSLEKSYKYNPYNDKNTLATIVASENSQRYLRFCFPKAEIFKMRLGINEANFKFSTEKNKQICFMPRKMEEDVRQVVNILKQRGKLKDWNLVPIDHKTETEVADIMKKSVFFLNFNRCEGFGLPAAEAMACGCYVIGYHGQGGKEYFKPEFSEVIQDGDIIEYVQKIERLIERYEKNPQEILQIGRFASKFILSQYSLERESDDTLKIWNKILEIYYSN